MQAVSALRVRAGALAPSQLRGAAEEALAGALGKLGEHLRGPAGRVRSLERMREVIERDRALAFAGQPDSAATQPELVPPQAPQPLSAPALEQLAPPAREAEPCQEPIRTRTMARLLAAQGHPERALAIYVHLSRQQPDDRALLEELATLRASQGAT